LQGPSYLVISEHLLSHAMSHPDKSARVTPAEVASRRAAIWRTHILGGRNKTRTAALWELVSGERISRQAIAKQLATVEEVLRLERKGSSKSNSRLYGAAC
jgi:hypothetical protein